MVRCSFRVLLELYRLDKMKDDNFNEDCFNRFAEYVESYLSIYNDFDEILSNLRRNVLYLPINSFEYARSFLFYVDKMIN